MSIGYGGRRLAAFVDVLVRENIDVLMDVRLRAVSAIPGFSGVALGRAVAAAGIEYRHASPLGNPQDNRAPFHEGPLEAGLVRFRELLAGGPAHDALEELATMARQRRVAVLCAERDHARCHRQVIIEQAQKLSPGVAVTVLT